MKYPLSILPCAFIFIIAIFSSFSINAAGVVGTGTSASCTEAAFDAALLGGGTVTFNCGARTHTIFLTGSKTIRESTLIDGEGRIILDGGGFTQIFYNSGADFQIQNITLRNARSIQGSAIFNDMGIVRVDQVQFNLNIAVRPGPASTTSGGRGGAVFNANGDMTIINSRFVGNQADNWGGAIFTTGGTVNIVGGAFLLNSVPRLGYDGGAIANGSYGEAGSTLNILESQFSLNTTPLTGGAIFSTSGNLSVENSFFASNFANVGGAIGTRQDPTNSSQVSIVTSTLTNNMARYSGGGLYIFHPIVVTESTLRANRARQFGGALFLGEDLNGDISNTTFTGNSAVRNGGAIFNSAMHFSLINSTLAFNNAALGGGVFNSRFTPANSTRLIRNSTFSRNQANRGGGVYDEPSATGGIPHSGVYATTIEYSTFAYNQAREEAGGAAIFGVRGGVTLRALIVAYSTGVGCNTNLAPVYTLLEYPDESCGGGTWSDPLLEPLANNGGFTQTHALRTGSPAIDAVVAPVVIGSGTADDPLRCSINVDQRNYSRYEPRTTSTGLTVSDCDAGAYEHNAVVSTTVRFPLVENVETTPEPTLPAVPTLIPVVVNCTPFRLTSPLNGLPNGIADFYWDAAPGATQYALSVFNEQGQQVANFSVNAPTTTLAADVGIGSTGNGINFTWSVQALNNGRVYCTQQITIPRESPNNPAPQATAVPQCGNGIQEVGETPNTCPNGY